MERLFDGRHGQARLRAKLITTGYSALNRISNIGTLRLSLTTDAQNCNNGFVAGTFDLNGAGLNSYLVLDTSQSNGSTVNIPSQNSDLYINFLNMSESYMNNIPEYHVYLYFDCDDENPTNKDRSMYGPV